MSEKKYQDIKICILIIMIFIIIFLGNYILEIMNIYNNEKVEKEFIETNINKDLQDNNNERNHNKKINEKIINLIIKDEKNDMKKILNKANNKKFIGDCIISIPAIDLKKVVYNGKNRIEHLKDYELITATDDMKYKNGGNYIICGHASRLYGHSLNRLSELQIGNNIIIYDKKQREYHYKIKSINYIEMDKTNLYSKQENNNQITILSCAKQKSKMHYIVIVAK